MSIAASVRVCLLRISRSLGMKPYSSSEWSRMLLILCIHIMYISKLVILCMLDCILCMLDCNKQGANITGRDCCCMDFC